MFLAECKLFSPALKRLKPKQKRQTRGENIYSQGDGVERLSDLPKVTEAACDEAYFTLNPRVLTLCS